MLEGSLWSEPPFYLGVLSLPHVCLCRFVSRLAVLNGDQEGSPAAFLVFSIHAEQELLSKEQHFSREVHKGSTNSVWVFFFFFFFFELLLKTSAKYYQWEGKSTKKSEMQLNQPLKKYQSEWRRKALHFFNFLHLTRDSCFQRKSLLTPQTIVQLCPVFSEMVHN